MYLYITIFFLYTLLHKILRVCITKLGFNLKYVKGISSVKMDFRMRDWIGRLCYYG